MDSKLAVLDSLVSTTILPGGSGNSFDPDTVQAEGRAARPTLTRWVLLFQQAPAEDLQRVRWVHTSGLPLK